MAEGDGSMVREVLGEESVAVKAPHFVDGENANRAERMSLDRQDFAFRDIGL